MDDIFMDTTPILRISEMANTLVGSEIIKQAQEVKAKIAAGEEIFNYTIGDFNTEYFPIPKLLGQYLMQALDSGETNYPQANGIPALRKAVSRFLHTRAELEYNEEQVLISCGARPIINAFYQTVIDPGDVVLYPVPSWNNNHYCHLTRAKGVEIETRPESNFMPLAASLKPYISDAVMIALCSPQNPTGTVFDRKQLMDICDLILEENRKRSDMVKPVYLLFDQIYWLLTGEDSVHYDPVNLAPEMKNYTLYVDGMSKAFAATGLRLGWGYGPAKIINKMRAINSHMGAWAPKAEQVAAARYLQEDTDIDAFIKNIRKEVGDRLIGFYKGFTQLRDEHYPVDAIAPQGGLYLTVKIDILGKKTVDGHELSKTDMVTKYLLEHGKIALVPFSSFGSQRNHAWYRLSVGTADLDEIPSFFDHLKRALDHLS